MSKMGGSGNPVYNPITPCLCRYDGGDEEERDLFEELAGSAANTAAAVASQPARSQHSLTAVPSVQ